MNSKDWLRIGIVSSLFMWLLMLFTFAIGALNGGMVTISLNHYGEMLPEVVLLPTWLIITIYAFWKGYHD